MLPDDRLRDLLQSSENAARPSPEFVESLNADLLRERRARRSPLRRWAIPRPVAFAVLAPAVLVIALVGASWIGSRWLPSGPVGGPVASSSPSPSATSTPEPTGGSFTVCPSTPDGAVCPLPPGDYFPPVHDTFRFSVSEGGWQEERQQSAEFETRIVLSRVDDPDLRLTFRSGSTGPTSPVELGETANDIPGFTASGPVDLTISGTDAQYLDLVSAGAQAPATFRIEDLSVSLEPDRSYRVTLAKIPMQQESATLVMVTEAPADKFATFVTMADAVVKSVTFEGS